MDEQKFCKDCRHAERKDGALAPFPRCQISKTLKIDLVSGEENGGFCQVERESLRDDGCGKDARFFEPIQ